MILQTADELRALLARTRTIAVVGASPDRLRPSNGVFRSLRGDGRFDVQPVNPDASAVEGVLSYPSLLAYSHQHGAPDLVDIFRAPRYAAKAARDAVAAGAKAIWFQLGVIDERAIALADEAGLDVVVDRCLAVDALALRPPT